jgi:predicted DNA-binding transcriptional regulator
MNTRDDVEQRLAIAEAEEQIDQMRLTHREREVLILRCRGCTIKHIAARLCISPHTVKNHITNVLDKLCPNRERGLGERADSYWICYLFGMCHAADVLPAYQIIQYSMTDHENPLDSPGVL